jgi:hypothetical protein
MGKDKSISGAHFLLVILEVFHASMNYGKEYKEIGCPNCGSDLLRLFLYHAVSSIFDSGSKVKLTLRQQIVAVT